MGNCLPTKRRQKKNRVSPMPVEEISEVLSKGADIRPENPNDPADMVKALTEDDTPEKQLTSDAAKKLAVAFTVDLGDNEPKPKPQMSKPQMPKRLTERLAAEQAPKSEFEFTDEEECLMADIMREQRLKEVKERGVQEEIKVYDAKRKRLALEKSREAQLEERARCSTPVAVSEARQRVKELAEADRKKAAERRKDSLKH